MRETTTNVVLLRVGVDSKCGGIHSPLFETGKFEFVCIPDDYSISPHTYGNINGSDQSKYFPARKQKKTAKYPVHLDPEFGTYTYGDPTDPKKSLQRLNAGDYLVFYCGMQRWDNDRGWDKSHRPALYIFAFFKVAIAKLAIELKPEELRKEFSNNCHVQDFDLSVAERKRLVLVKGGPGSKLLKHAHQTSGVGKNSRGKRLLVLSREMRKHFGTFPKAGGFNSIERSAPRWVGPRHISTAIEFIKSLK